MTSTIMYRQILGQAGHGSVPCVTFSLGHFSKIKPVGSQDPLLPEPYSKSKIVKQDVAPSQLNLTCYRGWGQLGVGCDVPDTVLLLDDCPHDWLFPQCCAVVHHGGAGTTAAGRVSRVCRV